MLTNLNQELDQFAPEADLRSLASRGIRGEFFFPTPSVLIANPMLLGYYRLLLGFSQKEFYNKGKLGRFKSMEEKAMLSGARRQELPELCLAMAKSGSELLHQVGIHRITIELLDDLTLLSLGPQLRGSNNTKIGKLADQAVFDLIRTIVDHAIERETGRSLELRNSSGRKVSISFAADPDIIIVEQASTKSARNIVAIEIKGGADQSNIWNRLGEAEKSHQTAKANGFPECWTIYNVGDLDLKKAKEKSPSSNHFYNLRDLLQPNSKEFAEFTSRLVSVVGIREQ